MRPATVSPALRSDARPKNDRSDSREIRLNVIAGDPGIQDESPHSHIPRSRSASSKKRDFSRSQGASQSSSRRPGMFWKSAVLWVTRVKSWTSATEAMSRSRRLTEMPTWSNWARTIPNRLAHAESKSSRDDLGEQVILDPPDRIRPVLSVVSPGVKLAEDDGRDAKPLGVLDEAMHQPGRPLQMSRANVRIQQEIHSGISFRESRFRSR